MEQCNQQGFSLPLEADSPSPKLKSRWAWLNSWIGSPSSSTGATRERPLSIQTGTQSVGSGVDSTPFLGRYSSEQTPPYSSEQTPSRHSFGATMKHYGSALREFSASQKDPGFGPDSPRRSGRSHGPGSPMKRLRSPMAERRAWQSLPDGFDLDGSGAEENVRSSDPDRFSSNVMRRHGLMPAPALPDFSPPQPLGPDSRFRSDNPMLNSSRPRRGNPFIFVPFAGAGAEACSFPHYPDCCHCGNLLKSREARYGTGLCDGCYGECEKGCRICSGVLGLKELRWYSGLCNTCYDSCDKACHFCSDRLEFTQLHWQSGLCDKCYDTSDKSCRMCQVQLEMTKLHWRSGLCDPCYDSCDKSCSVCKVRLAPGSLRWGSGLCDPCFDKSEKCCRICSDSLQFQILHYQSGLCDKCYDTVDKKCLKCPDGQRLALGQLHWRSGLCDSCYDKSDKVCKSCKAALGVDVLHWGSGLCDTCYSKVDKTCQVCKNILGVEVLHWGTGFCDSCWSNSAKECKLCFVRLGLGDRKWGTSMCDSCYDGAEKDCKLCESKVPLGALHWGSSLCDKCWDSCEKLCKKCNSFIGIGNLRWGSGLCNSCYDGCDKICRICNRTLPFGQVHWATGCCDTCYDKRQDRNKKEAATVDALHPGVWAAIVVQFVFYMAPALLTPALFLQITRMCDDNSAKAAAAYAAVLTTASIVSMIAPIPLGIWAEKRGEREVYVGISLIASLSGLALSIPMDGSSAMVLFALAWGGLNAPPAIRGVRAVHFARNVKPEDLSRAGQLASSAGLLGSVLGPIAATLIQRHCDHDGFEMCAFVATVAHCASALALRVMIPAPRRAIACDRMARQMAPTQEETHECSECNIELSEEESKYRSYLCSNCYANYKGLDMNFERYKWFVLLCFCTMAGLLELSMNAGVLATFQPIAVTQLGWGSTEIAYVNVISASLSVVVSLISAQLRLAEGCQVSTAAGLYCAGVIFFTIPPANNWTCIAGLILGLKAQILFMAPFTSIFSRLIGRTRVTNWLTICLCLAPAVGGAVGTILSPFLLQLVNTIWFMTAAIPAVIAFVFILFFLHRFDGSW